MLRYTLSVICLMLSACYGNDNIGEKCTSDSDCSEVNVCTVIGVLDDYNCDGSDPNQCINDTNITENFVIDRSTGTCNEKQSECQLGPCRDGEVCVYTSGLSDYTCQAKYEARVDGFPCHNDSVCASGQCILFEASNTDMMLGVCAASMTSAE